MTDPTKITPEELAEIRSAHKAVQETRAQFADAVAVASYLDRRTAERYGIQGDYAINLDGTISSIPAPEKA